MSQSTAEKKARIKAINSFLEQLARLTPVMISVSLVIMLMGAHIYQEPVNRFPWLAVPENTAELYNYAKLCGVISAVAFGLCYIIVITLIGGKFTIKKMPKTYIALGSFAGLILLSFAFSEYKEFTLWGFRGTYEGTVTWLCYLFIMFYTINAVHSLEDVKMIFVSLIICVTIICTIGLFQINGLNFWATKFAYDILVPENLRAYIPALSQTFQTVYASQTVFNINYVSLYISMLIPIFAMIFISLKNVAYKAVIGAFFLLLCYNFIGSRSSGGVLGIFFAIVLATILFNKNIMAWWRSIAILVLLFVLSASLNFSLLKEELKPLLSSLGKNITTAVKNTMTKDVYGEEQVKVSVPVNADTYSLQPERIYINYIETKENSVVFSFDDQTFEAFLTPDQDGKLFLECFNEDGTKLELKSFPTDSNVTIYYFTDPNYKGKVFMSHNLANGGVVFAIHTPDKDWNFVKSDKMYFVNPFGQQVEMKKVESYGFENNLQFGSHRGFIWSRTFPMLKDTLILGKGANAFCLYFPHNDYAGTYNSRRLFEEIVDKPHNLYLGIIFNTGLLSLISFLFLAGLYAINSFRLYFKFPVNEGPLYFVGSGIFLGVMAFLGSSLTNDSNLSVMPMFFGLFGIGFAINYIIKGSE